jgi:hypothetical protein
MDIVTPFPQLNTQVIGNPPGATNRVRKKNIS